MKTNSIPLAVDLDGSLIQTDMLFESFIRVLKAQPWLVLLMPFWLLQGIANLKKQLAVRAEINLSALPFNQEFLKYLQSEKAAGRELILATGSNEHIAKKISQNLTIFSKVLASDDKVNLTGSKKAALLVDLYGEKGFDYAGNESKDKKIWQKSNSAIVVGNQALVKQAEQVATVSQSFAPTATSPKSLVKAMRIHQWVKNFLIFVPLVTAHLVLDFGVILQALMAFVAFGLIASGTYIINDLFDLDSDRVHSTKCQRPFASGEVSIKFGLFFCGALLASGFSTLFLLPAAFAATLGVYFVVTLSYSLRLKAIASVDILLLSFLYTIRVVAGATAIGVDFSFWLLAFSMFIFFSLAIVKRVSELINMEKQNKVTASGRGYTVEDRPILESLGTASGYMAVLVFALYINSPEVVPLYEQPQILWIMCLLILFWTTRVWMLTARGMMHEDPIVFAIKDRVSWLIGFLAGVVLVLATGVPFTN